MKKLAILLGFAVIVLGIMIVTLGMPYLQYSTENYVTPTFPQSIGSEGDYVLATSYPSINDLYPVYKTVLPLTKDEQVKHLKNLFDLSENSKQSAITDEIIEIIDDSKNSMNELTVFPNSGAYICNIPEKFYPYYTDVQPDLPSDVESRAIATKYLLELNLLPDDVHFKEIRIGSQYEENTPTSYTVFDLTKDVRFMKEIQGIPVYNAGLTVTIGEKGEVVGITNSIRELNPEPVQLIKIITPEQAYQRLLSNDLVIKPLPEDYNEILITNITLGYWIEIPTYSQKYILPVYAFSGISVRGDKEEQIMRYVSAVESSERQYFS